MNRTTRVSAPRRVGALLFSAVLLVGACSSTSSPAPGASGGGGGGATKHVAIVNKDMTDDEIKAAVAAEGGLTVGNWTYTATDELVNQFQKYVKATYGADIKLTYVGSQSPSEYLTKLSAAKNSGSETPFDVIAVEENYWQDAMDQDLVDAFLPSDLVPNEKLLLDGFKHSPNALAFQAASFIALVYNKTKQP